MASIFRKAVWAFVNHPAPEWVKLSGAVGLFVGLAVYSVSKKRSQKMGEGLFDSEKPQALLNETERTLEEERAALEASQQVPATADDAQRS